MKNFPFTRWLRLIIGTFFLFAAINDREWILGIFAILLLVQGIFNWGCGIGGQACANNSSTYNPSGFDHKKAFKKGSN